MTESSKESTFDVKYDNTVKSTTQQVCVLKNNRIFRTKLRKEIDFKRPSNTKQINSTKYLN